MIFSDNMSFVTLGIFFPPSSYILCPMRDMFSLCYINVVYIQHLTMKLFLLFFGGYLEKPKIHAAIYPELRICFNYWDGSLKPQQLNFVWESLLSLLIVRERFLSFCFSTALLYWITRYPFSVSHPFKLTDCMSHFVLWVTRHDFGLCKLVNL